MNNIEKAEEVKLIPSTQVGDKKANSIRSLSV